MAAAPLSPDQMVKPRHFELRVSLLFVALFIPGGVHLPYFPLWLESAGFGASEIAVILAAPMFARVVSTPLITAYADKAKDRVNVLIACAAISLLVSFGYFLQPSYALVLAVSLALVAVWTPHSTLADSLALSGVRRFRSDYSRMRVWGSVSFLLASIGGGLILGVTGAVAVPVLISLGMALTLVAAFAAPRLGRPRFASPLSAAGIQKAAPSLLNRRFVLFVAGTGLINASHGLIYAFGSIHWKAIGVGETTIGALWAWGVGAEVVLFAVFTRVFGRTSPSRLLGIAAAAAVLRWSAMPFFGGDAAGLAAFFGLQTLHALSTGLVLLGVQKMIAETVDDGRIGAAQGAAFFANGTALAAVTLASGSIYASLGASGFHIMSLVAVAGAMLIALGAVQPQSAGAGGETIEPS